MARLRWHALASHMPLTCFSHASHMLLTVHPFDANFLVLCSPSDVGSSAHTYDKSDLMPTWEDQQAAAQELMRTAAGKATIFPTQHL